MVIVRVCRKCNQKFDVDDKDDAVTCRTCSMASRKKNKQSEGEVKQGKELRDVDRDLRIKAESYLISKTFFG